MSLETVLEEILAQGAREEQAILSQAEAERSRLVGEAEGQADELRSRKLAETLTRVEALRREILSASEFEVRRRLLIARRELMEDFHQRVLQTLGQLPKSENDAILEILLERGKETLPRGRVHARPADFPLLTKAGHERGQELRGAGGFQLESDDRSVLLDFRLETLLENAWKRILNMTQKLFVG